jgi:hypothetical protein
MPTKLKTKKPKSGMRYFYLKRIQDESGVSGEGIVAEGVEFTNGQCAMHWLTQFSSIAIYPSLKELINIHGHEGKTKVEYYE